MNKVKLYCYVDETGQDTEGKFFLVALVLVKAETKEEIEQQLINVEEHSNKRKTKWSKSLFSTRQQYIKELVKIRVLQESLYYSIYKETKTYIALTALTIAKAVSAKNEDNYSVTIIIDGLTKKDTEKVRSELKKLRVKYDTIRGMKDEQSVYLRLADALAGFVRDYLEKQNYTEELFMRLKSKNMINEA